MAKKVILIFVIVVEQASQVGQENVILVANGTQ